VKSVIEKASHKDAVHKRLADDTIDNVCNDHVLAHCTDYHSEDSMATLEYNNTSKENKNCTAATNLEENRADLKIRKRYENYKYYFFILT